jgi:hypothetical protein
MSLGNFYLTVNNLVTTVHKQSKPTSEQGSPHNFEPQQEVVGRNNSPTFPLSEVLKPNLM